MVSHLINDLYSQNNDLLAAVRAVIPKLHGAFALGIVHVDCPDELIAVRLGSPLVIGVGIGENFIASDQLALLPVTCLLYTSPSPRDKRQSRMPSSA